MPGITVVSLCVANTYPDNVQYIAQNVAEVSKSLVKFEAEYERSFLSAYSISLADSVMDDRKTYQMQLLRKILQFSSELFSTIFALLSFRDSYCACVAKEYRILS